MCVKWQMLWRNSVTSRKVSCTIPAGTHNPRVNNLPALNIKALIKYVVFSLSCQGDHTGENATKKVIK